jgi:D-alanyl-D-alanine carboxypeptidase (penicillin-binding protein 5/6)
MARRRFPALVVALAVTVAACSGDDGDGADDAESTAAANASAPTNPDPASTMRSSPEPSASNPASASGSTSTSTSTTASSTSTTAATTTTTTIPGALPRVQAAAWTVYDVSQGEMLASNQATARRPVASLMKLLTAEVAIAAGQPTKLVTAPSEGLVLSDDESVIDIRAGQELSRDLLVRAMLKASANDAARLLALDIAGSEAAFAALMNSTAQQLGLNDTRAANATGLDAEGQYSTANDMTLLGARLMNSINFQIAVRDTTAELNGQAYPNTNELLGAYPGADGIKTGYTSGAGWCILASAIRDGRRLIVAVLGAPTEEARYEAAAALLDWGFAQPR